MIEAGRGRGATTRGAGRGWRRRQGGGTESNPRVWRTGYEPVVVVVTVVVTVVVVVVVGEIGDERSGARGSSVDAFFTVCRSPLAAPCAG